MVEQSKLLGKDIIIDSFKFNSSAPIGIMA